MKQVVLIIVLCLALTLFGCSSPQTEPAQTASPSSTPATQTESSESPSSDTTSDTASEEPSDTQAAGGSKILVTYFSASGNTQTAAEEIAAITGADLFEIVPEEPYTDSDLNWRDENSRVSREHEDPALQNIPLAETTVPGWENYDVIFLGYPIWWGNAAWPVNTFVDANDFNGKTVIPFCTSASSGLGSSAQVLEALTETGDWMEGQRFASAPSSDTVAEWVDTLEIQS